MKEWIKEWGLAFLIGAALAMVIKTFVIDVVYIRGQSMEPTFQNGDVVLAEKLTGRFGEFDYGEVVIVSAEKIEGIKKHLIKRVIGKEGDTIEIKDGVLYRNGKEVKEEYIKETIKQDFEKVTVGKGQVFVMGDNRNNSTDSRSIGAFDVKEIKGRVFIELADNVFVTY